MQRSILCLACILFTLAGCSTLTIKTDYDPQADFSGLHVFSWSTQVQPPTGNIKLDNPLLDARIRQSVEDQLLIKGYAKDTTGNPDFLMRYLVTVQDKTDVQTIDTYYGAPTPFWFGGPYYPAGIWVPQTIVYNYEEGTLILDFLNTKTQKLIWRGSASAEVTNSGTPEQKKAKIENAVQKLLAQFPPKGK